MLWGNLYQNSDVHCSESTTILPNGMRLGNSISVMLELLGHMWQSHPARLGINSKVAAQERSCFVPPAIACWAPLMPKAKGGIATIEPALSRIAYKLLPKPKPRLVLTSRLLVGWCSQRYKQSVFCKLLICCIHIGFLVICNTQMSNLHRNGYRLKTWGD